ncbi:hypothetical protein L7F22_056703 [Adiantum nelumboides]|nr:hypothetical protein [Adiantum nelumboides]
MYVKCGALVEAQKAFDKLPLRSVVAWTALIAGYCQQGHSEEALDCFDQMRHEGLNPDAMTFTCVLKACGSTGAEDKGKEIHAEIMRGRFLEKGSDLGNAMVDMYAKCGALEKAQEVFDMLPKRDVFSWTALIGGYCHLGYCDEALKLFEQMKFEGLSPDAVTLSCVLKSCGIAGATEKGQMLFETVRKNYGIVPALDHHSCMVDLSSKEGQFDKAMAIIKQMMPTSSMLLSWFPVLDACFKWGNMKLGSMAFEQKMKFGE